MATHEITSFFSTELNKTLIRAHHFGDGGYSTKTCENEGEARAFLQSCDRRKVDKTKMSDKDRRRSMLSDFIDYTKSPR